MSKRAITTKPLHPLLAERWSPRAFADRAVAPDTVETLLEAARWAPSCYNEQPWRFLVAPRGDGDAHARLAATLAPTNRVWAERAPVLLLAAAVTTFAHNGKPNAHARHDVGIAAALITVQATGLGLGVHQMAGFDRDAARAAFALPADLDLVTVLAIGYPGDPATLPPEVQAKEARPRARRPLADLVLGSRG